MRCARPASATLPRSWPGRPDGSAAIVPGRRLVDGERADVMRGEEVQILGAVGSGRHSGRRLVCHPGTHNKWIDVRGGQIHEFRTVMTGEMFNLLRAQSILADLLRAEVEPGAAFRDGRAPGP